jgi:hypothetical protein
MVIDEIAGTRGGDATDAMRVANPVKTAAAGQRSVEPGDLETKQTMSHGCPL